jgi:hypothetical protein
MSDLPLRSDRDDREGPKSLQLLAMHELRRNLERPAVAAGTG